jgi:hypothetical protein
VDKGYIETEYNGCKLEIIPGWKLCEPASEDIATEDGKWLVSHGSFTRRLFAIGDTEEENKKYYGSYYVWYEKFDCKLGYIFTKEDHYGVELLDGMTSYGFTFKKHVSLSDIAIHMAKKFDKDGKE